MIFEISACNQTEQFTNCGFNYICLKLSKPYLYNGLNQNSKIQTQKHKTQSSKYRSHNVQTQNSKGPYTKHNDTYRLPYDCFVCSL